MGYDLPSVGVVEQLKRALAICKKDIRIYYLKGPVIIYGILLPLFLFAAFLIGRDIPLNFLVSGLTVMTIFFTSTAVVPLLAPWETRAKTLERLVSAPVSIAAVIVGDVSASFLFGVLFSLVPLILGLSLGISIIHPLTLLAAILLASFCFSSLAAILSTPPTDIPANVMMLSTLIKFPLLFVSGVFIPLEKLPNWGRLIASFSPLTYFTDLARHSIEGTSYYPTILDLVTLLVFTLIFLTIAIKLHEKNMSKRL